MKREFSAGGIVFKRVKTHNLLWLVAQHSQHKGWVFPKGLIGDQKVGESSAETAVREVEEETGVKAKIIKKLKKPAIYFYVWQGEKRIKTVSYFLMEFTGGDINNHDFEMTKIEWWPKEKVEKELTYKSDKEAFKETLDLVKKLPS